jgi:hypothetical protein
VAAGVHGAHDTIQSSSILGESFIALGVLGALAATVQHIRILKRLAHPDFPYNAMRLISVIVATLLLLVGAFGFLAIIL